MEKKVIETLPEGTKLNHRYFIKGVIGEGGFGTVYEAFDLLLNCTVAVKECLADGPALNEAEIMEALKNVPYVVGYRDSFDEKQKRYIVMNMLRGQSLSGYLKSKRKVSSQEIMVPLENIFIALEHMHSLGILHRDISPGNLFYTEDGELYLIDFGTATALNPDSHLYNKTHFVHKGYEAPESHETSLQGPWSDIYSLCATIFYLFTGDGVPDPEKRGKIDSVPGALAKCSLSAKQQNALLKGLQVDYRRRTTTLSQLRDAFYGDHKQEEPSDVVAYSAGTDIGSRKSNQDNLMVDGFHLYEGRDFMEHGTIACHEGYLHMVAVCDGVGGANGGDLASRAVAQALRHFVHQYRESQVLPEHLIRELMDQINEKILSLGRKIGKTGSTVSVLLWKGNQYYMANIGDSPVYLLRKRKFEKISEDQTMAMVKQNEGLMFNLHDMNTLVNFMGKSGVAGSEMMAYRHGYLQKGDTFLLCSDGVSAKIESSRLGKILRKPNEEALKTIYKLLGKCENNDNCTAIIVKF